MNGPKLLWMVVTLLIGTPFVAGAEGAARVNGQEIDRSWVSFYAQRFYPEHVKDGTPTQAAWRESLEKVVANRAILLRARKEAPELVNAVTRAADLALARDYYVPYLNEIAAPVAEKRVTVESVLLKVPEQKDVAMISQIVMTDRAALEKLRKRIVAGEVSFEDAAREHSIGLSAKLGGDLGGVERTDSRYPKAAMDTVFATPKGGVTPVVSDFIAGRWSIIWVRDRKTAAESRRAQAESSLETFREAEKVRVAQEEIQRFAAEGRAELFLTDANIGEATPPGDRPAFRVDKVTYYVADVLSRSGGRSHGNKDILTIAENCYRDLILQKLYMARTGRRSESQLERDVMREHYIARRYLALQTEDLEVSDADIDRYLAENPDKYRLPLRAEMAMIHVKTPDRLAQVQERLAQGVAFETVAKGWSQDKQTAALGGKLGVVPVAQVAGDPKQMKPGFVSDPMRVEEGEGAGWYLFKVYQVFPEAPGTRANLGEQVIGGIRSIVLAHKKEDRLGQVMAAILGEAKVEFL